jgi:copper chaperone CopZ
MLRILYTCLLAATLFGAAFAHDHEGEDDHDHRDTHDHAEQSAKTAKGVVKNADVEIDVLGMVCDFCATAMEKSFSKHAAVDAVSVDLDTKTVRLTFREGQSMSDEAIARVVKKSGYKTDGIRRAKS